MTKVLIVDDEVSVRETLAELLQLEGFDADSAAGSDQAMDMVESSSYDVVIIDVVMPGIDGVELAGKISEMSDRPQIIMMTGQPTIDAATAAVRTGVFDFILKPFTGDAFCNAVSRAANFRALNKKTQKLQREIEISAVKWQHTFDRIPFPVFIVNFDGTITQLNKEAAQLAEKELAGLHIDQAGNAPPWRDASPLIQQIIEGGTPESVQARDNESGRTWDVSATILTTRSGGAGEQVIIVARDITREIQLQESLKRSEMIASMGTLVAGVAHEVRNPLFSISATLDAFEARFADRQEYKKYTSIFRSEVNRLNSLMQSLLEYGKPPDIQLENVDLKGVIENAIKACKVLIEKKNVEVEVDIDFNTVKVYVDEARILQVFQNIIENALHYSPEKATIHISARQVEDSEGGWIECSLVDEGPGFEEQVIERVFEPFYTTRYGGTGLGLSIVQRIVEDHQGKIVISNLEGQGAEVLVILPAVA